MRFQQIVHQPADLLRVQFGGGVRIEHGRLVDVLAVAGQGRLDGQFLDVDVGLHQGGQLGRQDANLRRLDAVAVDHAGDFDDAGAGQIGDQSAIGDVAVDDPRLAGFGG
jgi:hypothetical protein